MADADSTYEPEFSELTFTPIDPNGAQNWEYFELTGPPDGTPFTVTPYTADGDIEIAVTRTQVGQPAKNEKQKVTLGSATGGTSNRATRLLGTSPRDRTGRAVSITPHAEALITAVTPPDCA